MHAGADVVEIGIGADLDAGQLGDGIHVAAQIEAREPRLLQRHRAVRLPACRWPIDGDVRRRRFRLASDDPCGSTISSAGNIAASSCTGMAGAASFTWRTVSLLASLIGARQFRLGLSDLYLAARERAGALAQVMVDGEIETHGFGGGLAGSSPA